MSPIFTEDFQKKIEKRLFLHVLEVGNIFSDLYIKGAVTKFFPLLS